MVVSGNLEDNSATFSPTLWPSGKLSTMKTLVALALLCAGLTGCALTERAPYEEFAPPGGQGPVVIVLSGTSGPHNYIFFSKNLAAQGYDVALFDGNSFLAGDVQGDENLRQVILQAQHSPHAAPGKVGAVGLSLGGADVLAHASTQPDLVSVVVAYYPATRDIQDKEALIRRWQVPTVAFAGTSDNAGEQHGCCLIENAKAMAASASGRGAPFDLVVYPGVQHGFNLAIPGKFDRPATEDAWQRTLAALHQNLGP